MRHPRTLRETFLGACFSLPSPGTISALASGCAQSEGQAAGSIAGQIASIANLIPIPGVGSILSALGGIIGSLLAGPPENYPAYIYFSPGPVPQWIVGPTTNPDVVDVHGVYGGAQSATAGAIIQAAATIQQWINNAIAAGYNFGNAGGFQIMLGEHVPGTLWAAPPGAEWAPQSSDHESTVGTMDGNGLVQAVVAYLSPFAVPTTTPTPARPFVPSQMIGGQWAGGKSSPLAATMAYPKGSASMPQYYPGTNIPVEPASPPVTPYADGYDGYHGAMVPSCAAATGPATTSGTPSPASSGGAVVPASSSTPATSSAASSGLVQAGFGALANPWVIGAVGIGAAVLILMMSGKRAPRRRRRR